MRPVEHHCILCDKRLTFGMCHDETWRALCCQIEYTRDVADPCVLWCAVATLPFFPALPVGSLDLADPAYPEHKAWVRAECRRVEREAHDLPPTPVPGEAAGGS